MPADHHDPVRDSRLSGWAAYVLWPFGRTVVPRPGAGVASLVGNVDLVSSWPGCGIAAGHVVHGLPAVPDDHRDPLGIANFKLAFVAIAPLARRSCRAATRGPWATRLASLVADPRSTSLRSASRDLLQLAAAVQRPPLCEPGGALDADDRVLVQLRQGAGSRVGARAAWRAPPRWCRAHPRLRGGPDPDTSGRRRCPPRTGSSGPVRRACRRRCETARPGRRHPVVLLVEPAVRRALHVTR